MDGRAALDAGGADPEQEPGGVKKNTRNRKAPLPSVADYYDAAKQFAWDNMNTVEPQV